MYIPQIPAKDLWISNYGNGGEYSLNKNDGSLNTRKFRASLDYSLDLIKLREVYESVYRNKRFSQIINEKEYCYRVINVTFEYSVKSYNRYGRNTYCKLGYDEHSLDFNDSVAVVGGELAGIICNVPVETPVDKSVLGKYFKFEDGKYIASDNIETIKTVADVRKDIYKNGFICNGIKFVRWKRSAGSARVGKCLFIDESLFDKMHRWESCGIEVKYGSQVDLAAFESYISLTSSSIIDTIEIKPENILVIDDYISSFEEDVVCVTESGGVLEANRQIATIENSIFDGESLIDRSIMGKYQNKGMLLLRNRFFKSCTFNSNIQQWFEDNDIYTVEQLNGYTLATDIKDIKLITTPSSIKYCKFGTIEQWLANCGTTFGVVKYEKPPHFFEGRLVQAHYQLINSIQLDYEEVEKLLEPTFNFMDLVKTNPAVLRYWIKFNIDDLEEITPVESKTDIIYKLMSVNEDFTKTKLYHDFRADFLKSFTKNLKCGHVLVNGNYSTLCGNPIEMLRQSIGDFDGEASFEKNSIYSSRFDFDRDIIASRSPHITFSNVLVTRNRRNELIEKYMNPTKEIVYINSINENIMQRLAGCDFDSDTVMLTDNEVLIRGSKKYDNRFKVAVYAVGGAKVSRKYTAEDLADLDIKTSKNLIGEIINVSQELNSYVWDLIAGGSSVEEVDEIYRDICKLSIMSNIEIDKAKKEFVIDNGYELKVIRDKYKITQDDGRSVKPNFFAHIAKRKGYYDPEHKAYIKYDTAMDYLQTCVNKYRSKRSGISKRSFIPFSDMLVCEGTDSVSVNYKQIDDLFNFIDDMSDEIASVYANKTISQENKMVIATSFRQDCIEQIGRTKFNLATMIAVLKIIEKPEHAKHRKLVFYTLFGYPNTSFYETLRAGKRKIPSLRYNPGGEVDIYGTKFTVK